MVIAGIALKGILIQVLDISIKCLGAIAAGVVERKLTPELKNKLKSAESFFTTLSNAVKQSNKEIDAAKMKLTTEIAAIGEIKQPDSTLIMMI